MAHSKAHTIEGCMTCQQDNRAQCPKRCQASPAIDVQEPRRRASDGWPKATLADRNARHSYSTVTDFARFLGWSTFAPRFTAT